VKDLVASSPLPWIKLQTKLLYHLQLPEIPIAERGVLFYLLMLGGVSSRRGVVVGTDAEIARSIHTKRDLVTRTIDRLSAKPFEMVQRSDGGVTILNWDRYQASKGSDPEYRRNYRLLHGKEAEGPSGVNGHVNGQAVDKVLGESESEEERQSEPGTAPAFLSGTLEEDQRLPEVLSILKASQHRDAFNGKDLAPVLARYPQRDAAQTARDLVEKVARIERPGGALKLFESWLANAEKLEPPEREKTPEQIRHGYHLSPRTDCAFCQERKATDPVDPRART
jgi:hypothetical protein